MSLETARPSYIVRGRLAPYFTGFGIPEEW